MGLDGLDFRFLWVGILDSYGVWVGFGLVGWVGVEGSGGGVVGSGGGVVGSGLFGCFCYGFGGFFFFFGFLVLLGFWWVEGNGGVVGMLVAWW